VESIDDLFDESKISTDSALFAKRKFVNLIPLTNDETKVAREKRKKILTQKRYFKEFIFFTIYLVSLYMTSYYDYSQYKHTYKACLYNLFSINKNFSSVS
jgi:hypothetical protein